MIKRLHKLFFLFAMCSYLPFSLGDTNDVVRQYCADSQQRIVQDFVGFLKIPNEASDTQNIHKVAGWIVDAMKQRGLNPQLLQANDPKAPAAVYGEWKSPAAKRTLLFYAHYDGQPANADQWTITSPWQPVFRHQQDQKNLTPEEIKFPLDADLRVYGRSTSDDKAGVMAILTAFEALQKSKIPITTNIKFLFEGEEEAGSAHLGEITKQYKDLLQSDGWILVDGPVHQSGRKQVVFGVRGDVNVNITVYGPVRPLHSGHYGNWAPNPAMTLARLLTSMKDDSGRVMIAGWYDDVEPLGELELNAIKNVPRAEELLQKELGIAHPDGAGKSLQELLMEPSLNINGIRSADVGERARNVIPTTAMATLDLRLVKGNDVHRQFEKLVAHIRKQGFAVIDHDPSQEERMQSAMIARVEMAAGGYNAQRTRLDLPISKFVTEAVQSSTSEPVVILPALGGSLPLSIIDENLHCPTITVPLANYDNNQHAENENLRLGNLWDGIVTLAALMSK